MPPKPTSATLPSLPATGTSTVADVVAAYPGEPVLLADVRVGDLLCFRGRHPVSAGIREIDGCMFDHPAVVVRVDGTGIWFAEQNFDGFRIARLEDYDDAPELVLVRRPRTPGAEDFIVDAVKTFGASLPMYAADRLVDIVLVSLVRCVPLFESYDAERKRRFASRMDQLFRLGAATVGRSNTAVCVDLMLAAFDNQEPGPDGSSWSIVMPTRRIGTLTEWRDALVRFVDLLASNSAPGFDPVGWMRKIVHPGGLDQPDLHAVSESHEGGAIPLPPALPVLVEQYFLDKLLRQRHVPTPYDIVTSPSFADVGLLDPALFAAIREAA